MGYESNDASVLTNVSSDHLDLQGIHTLPELAEVKSTICRITKPDGWVVLNADDPLVAAVARRVRASVALLHAATATASPTVAAPSASAAAGRTSSATAARRGQRARARPPIVEVARVPITIGGLARHNVANALAAAGGARGLGATIAQVRDGLLDFAPERRALARAGSTCSASGRKVVIVDFAHNEAGHRRPCSTWPRGSPAGRPAGRRRSPRSSAPPATGPTTRCAGIGRIAAERAQRVAIKETLKYLRGRTRRVGRRRAAGRRRGRRRRSAADVPIYESETAALRAELNGAAGAGANGGRPDAARVIVLMCHEERDGVFELLATLGRAAGRRRLRADRARAAAPGPARGAG